MISRNLYITFLGDVVSLRSLLDLKAPPERNHESRLASLPLNPTEAALLKNSELTGRISIPFPSGRGGGSVADDQIFYLKNDTLSIEDFVEVYTIYKCKACDFSSCQKGKQLYYIYTFFLIILIGLRYKWIPGFNSIKLLFKIQYLCHIYQYHQAIKKKCKWFCSKNMKYIYVSFKGRVYQIFILYYVVSQRP